jgi:hypothetical protein
MIVKNDAHKIVIQIDKVQAEIFARIGERQRPRVAADPWNLVRRQAETDVRLNSFPMRRAHKWNLRADTNEKSRERREREHA